MLSGQMQEQMDGRGDGWVRVAGGFREVMIPEVGGSGVCDRGGRKPEKGVQMSVFLRQAPGLSPPGDPLSDCVEGT